MPPPAQRGGAASLAKSSAGDVDDSALEAAMHELGTKTKVATVHKALADVGERAQRLSTTPRSCTTTATSTS